MASTSGGGPQRPGNADRIVLRMIVRRILQIPLTILVLLYFLFDDLVLSWLRPLFEYAGRLHLFIRIGAWMQSLGPYQSLLLFAVPFVVLEPFKVGAVVLLGLGHFVSGGIMLATSHLLSLLVLERIFHVTKDKLLTIGWFAWAYGHVMTLKTWAFDRLKASWTWRAIAALVGRLRAVLHPVTALAKSTVLATAAWLRRLFSQVIQRSVK